MTGNFMGSMKKKLGLKGKTKPGEMISAMNKAKVGKIIGKGKVASKKIIKKII